MRTIAGLSVVLGVLATPVFANQIERACMASDRSNGDRTLCGCIQDAANLTLTAKDQKLAASFFQNPDRAQEIRASDRRSNEVFWKRYTNFGKTAEAFCQS